MADAFEDQIATAIAGELNGAGTAWHSLFAAEHTIAVATRSPWYKPAPKTLMAAVVPLTIERGREARVTRRFDYGVPIDLQVAVDPTDQDRMKTLSKAAEQIHDFFDDGHALTGMPGWFCLKSDRADVFNLSQLYSQQLWETLISVTVRGYKTP